MARELALDPGGWSPRTGPKWTKDVRYSPGRSMPKSAEARVATAARRLRCVELASQGLTYAEIAEALGNAVARRGDVTGCVLHTDRGSQLRSRKHMHALARHSMVGSMGRVGPARQRRHGVLLQPAIEERPGPAGLGHPRGPAHRDGHLDQTDLPPPSTPSRPRTFDPNRVRDHHDPSSQPGCITELSPNPAADPIFKGERLRTRRADSSCH